MTTTKSYTEQYKDIVNDVLENGKQDEASVVRTEWKDGSKATTISLLNKEIKFDNNSEEWGLLLSKFVAPKNPFRELRWIWQMKSNNVQKLRDMGCNVWNEWEIKEGKHKGTIGKAYGFQLANKKRKVLVDKLMLEMIDNGEICHDGYSYDSDLFGKLIDNGEVSLGMTIELDQVDWLLYNLSHPTKKYSRRFVVTLWCVEDLDEMGLEPCVYETHWQMWDGKLNVTVGIRSNDLALGNPYNIFQYAILHRMIAQVTGNLAGEICFKIDNAHIYERHVEAIKEQVNSHKEWSKLPVVRLNANIESFYDFKEDDLIVINYDKTVAKPYRYEVAI